MKQKRPFSAKGLFLKLSFSVGVFLLCVVVAEGVLRLIGYGDLEVYDPDPHLYWKLRPNQRCFTKVNHEPVRVNSQGTRGAEFQAAKPSGTIRLVSLGDSRTFGWGLAENQTYSAWLEQMLQEKFGGRKKIEVINAGVIGWSYPQMMVYFRDIGLRYQPDFVIIGEANGWTQFSEKSSPDFVKKFMMRVRLKNWLRRSAIYHYAVEIKLKDFYERYRTKFIPIDPERDPYFKEQQQSNPQEVFRAAIDGICSLAVSNHVQPVVLYQPSLVQVIATNPPAILQTKRTVAQKWNVPFVDPTARLRNGRERFYLDADPMHFNAEGNRILAEALFQATTNLMR